MNEISKYQSFEIMKSEVQTKEKKALFIGIDVAKDQHVACMGDNFGYSDDKVFSFSNDSKGYEELLKRVGLKISDHDYVIFGVEATGGYEKALSEYLHNKSYGVVRVPTVSVKRERELATGSWHKSDKRDTQAITRIMQRGVFQYYRFRDEHWENVDNLNRLNHLLTKRAKILQTTIRVNILPLIFPELNNYLQRLTTRFCEQLFQYYPSPHHIISISFEEFCDDMRNKAKITKNLKTDLKRIYDLAQKSIGKNQNYGSSKTLELRYLAEQLEMCQRQKRDVSKRIKHLLETHESFDLLQTIPGIGKKNAPVILSAIGDINRFTHPNQLISFFGLNLCYYQSGKYEGQKKISKLGDKKVRHALWLGVHNIYHKEGTHFYEIWQRKTQGKTLSAVRKRKLKVMLMVKLTRIIYSVLKNQTPYSTSYQSEKDTLLQDQGALE